MVWFTVWSLLVLATVGGAFLLGRDLWRKGKALVAELGRAAAVAGDVADRGDQLAAAAPRGPGSHDLLTDPAVHRARVSALREARAARRARRRGQHARTVRGWWAYRR
jgi:hypothetical protein